MNEKIQAVRGMKDILPEQSALWQHLEATVREVLAGYGYREIRLPLVEKTELFARSVGEHTDIVEKEMYTFTDRDGDSIALRPEATAGCVRAGISHGLFHNKKQRLWYQGPMFRYEKPQRGRYRQFHQVGAEAVGFPGPDIDAELLLVCARLWRRLGLTGLRLELNSLGTPASRAAYRQLVVEYFSDHREALDQDSQRRLGTNPLRILDSKVPEMQALIAAAPAITDHLDSESAEHFAAVAALLDEAGLEYAANPRLVRGLDYYSRTVFEWLTDRLGSQSAVCAGGRYDQLVEQIGGRPTPAIGWAMGLERLVELMEIEQTAPPPERPHAYLVLVGEEARGVGLGRAERLRDDVPGLRLVVHCGDGGFKAQLRAADRSGAEAALVLGESEVATGTVGFKPLRTEAPQENLEWDALAPRLRRLAAS